MPNRLAQETSPYLLQHANNPVDWYPWGPEALARSRAEQKPIFLSIGYSACHWCHVMEHESFEDPAIAGLLNESFVNIKVDREERPDLDQIYMNAVQTMTGRGGWPMSTFLTPDLQPFFGGTYWPPHARQGMPGFDQVILAVRDAWNQRREQAVEQARQLTQHLQAAGNGAAGHGELSAELLSGAAGVMERIFDSRHGGFGRAPKFPHAMDLKLLLRAWLRSPRPRTLEMVTLTLDKMAAGGIYEHLGGGFHRYSVDERWLVPHFEKMLYDNALLAGCYLEAFQATEYPNYERVVRETCDYVLREMTGPEGGFFSTLDADSEREEGRFYIWTPDEIAEVLGPDQAKTFCYVYDVTEPGNFEERNILNMPKTLEQCAAILQRDIDELQSELARDRAKLLEVRSRRVWPGLDDKVLVSWNALMIDALANACGVLGEPRYGAAAAKAAEFLLTSLRRTDGRLLHSWRNGQARLDAYLDDYSYLANALVSLYEADFNERWIDAAVELADTMLKHFADPSGGSFFYTADDHEQLITRQKDLHDSSVPSGNGMAAMALVRLGKLTGRSDFISAAEAILRSSAVLMEQSPTAAGQMLLALDMYLGPTPEIVILGSTDQPDMVEVLSNLRRRYVPRKVIACRSVSQPPERQSRALSALFEGKSPLPPEPTVFICQNFTCQAPVSGKEAALAAWSKLAQPQQ
ncbi:MAG: thioredoxin domain-containing protein [Planctomycetes bacterium]|nr:thioredoxin domain-containing protein [Planctomycetota bacterium]